MINLLESIDFYLEKGYEDAYATSKVAQDIILSKIAKSNYRNNITVKGGVVMFNITNDKRRATVDIDIDLIRYYLIEEQLNKYLRIMNIDYVDCLMLHSVIFTKLPLIDTYKEMNRMIELGKAKSLGLSNSNLEQLKEINE